MGDRAKAFIIKMMILLALLLCLSGCGRETIEILKEIEGKEEVEANQTAETPDRSELKMEDEKPEEIEPEETDEQKEIVPAVREIPVDFPFWSSALCEEVDYFTLTLAELEEPAGEYELRLYNQKGDVLQQISCGPLTEPIEISFGDFDSYPGLHVNDIEIFPADGSSGVYIGWNDLKLRFSEHAVEIPRYNEVRDQKMLIIEEGEIYQTRKIYQLDGYEVRRWLLNKDTGELEIWDCMDGESLFRGRTKLDKEGNPINKKYFDFLLWEDIYSFQESQENIPVPVYLDEPRATDGEWTVEYESREAFLEDFGFENSEPIYQCYDWHHDLLLELYLDKSTEQFCGIAYDGYGIDPEGKKTSCMYGFTVNGAIDKKWPGEDTYSKITEFRADEQDYVKDYEEFTEYTKEGVPDHFLSGGTVRTEGGEGYVRVMEIDYIYRDDGTLFYRDYHHSALVFPTNDSYLYSFYDEKGRVLYERGYITHGHLEDYYIYEDEGKMPTYHLELDYCHGYAIPYLERYQNNA